MGRPKGTLSSFQSAVKAKPKTANMGLSFITVKTDPYCKGCKYYSYHTHTCDYLLIERKPRHLICPPGKDCTVKVKGRRPMPKGRDAIDYLY